LLPKPASSETRRLRETMPDLENIDGFLDQRLSAAMIGLLQARLMSLPSSSINVRA
jgi:hypothetical protein